MAAGPVAARNRQLRQETLRELLSNKGLAQQVLVIAEKIEKLAPSETSEFELRQLKASAELKLKLVNKYLPDMKQVEGTFEHSHRSTDELTDEQLEHIAAGSGTDSAEQAQGPEKLH